MTQMGSESSCCRCYSHRTRRQKKRAGEIHGEADSDGEVERVQRKGRRKIFRGDKHPLESCAKLLGFALSCALVLTGCGGLGWLGELQLANWSVVVRRR